MPAGTLVRNEWLKLKKRPAAMVAVGLFAAVHILSFGGDLRAEGAVLALPEGWRVIVSAAPQLAAFIGAILLILMVASEFEWRTARQNVIDGLSRDQWFWAKTLLIPMLLAVFLGVQIWLGVTFAMAESGILGRGLLMEPAPLRALGGVALGFVGYASLALAIAVTVRKAGASIGILFLYMIVVEQLLASGLVSFSRSLAPVVRHFPLNVFDSLMRYVQWDPAMRDAAEAVGEGGQIALPELWSSPALVAVSLIWIAVLVGGSFLVFRRRDL